jgi:hypothetical protein
MLGLPYIWSSPDSSTLLIKTVKRSLLPFLFSKLLIVKTRYQNIMTKEIKPFKLTRMRVISAIALFILFALIFYLKLSNSISSPLFIISGFSLVISVPLINYALTRYEAKKHNHQKDKTIKK